MFKICGRHIHSPQEIPRNECCCCEQPIGKQQNGGKFVLLLCDWLFTTTTFVPWDFLWAMLMKEEPCEEMRRD